MSDNDSFISEVSEEVRRDRMFALWRKYSPFVIGGVVAIVAVAAGKTWLDHQAELTAQSAGGALIAASEGAPADAAAALTTLAAQTDHEGAALLAKLRAAAAHVLADDAASAIAIYDEVAANPAADLLLQDFATYRATFLRSADMSPEEAISTLTPIANGAGPFALLALEAQGLAHLETGDRDAAATAFRDIMQDDQAPAGLRQRVEAVMLATGIEPDTGSEAVEETDANG